MNGRSPAILDHLSALADTTRSRILLLLERRELSVSEICAVTQLPQSTISRHLKALADSGWVSSRGEGTSNVYTMTRDLDTPARRLWLLVMAWDLSSNYRTELARLRFAAKLGRERANEIIPPYPGEAAQPLPDFKALYAELAPTAVATSP